jgi:sulfonate transport system substrate-binding protein
MSITRRRALQRLGFAASAAALGTPTWAANPTTPTTIRIGVAQPAVGTPPSFAGSAISIAHAKGWIEEEFKPDGIKVEWIFFKGAGPAVNEALTNQQLDFAVQGDLPAIIAKAAGLKTKLIIATGVRSNIYIGVPPDSPLKTVEDLRGKRVSLFRGTNMHLPALRLLEAHGLTEKDLKILNLDTATYLAALSTKDIDAAIGAMDILRLRDKGQVRVLYSSKNDSPIFTRQGHVLVADAFADANPQLVQRVVNVSVRAAKWSSDEANRDEVLRLWARAGTPYEHWKEDYAGEPLRVRLNPNFDPFLVGRYKDAIEQAQRFKLSRAKFDADPWIDRRYLNTALRAQGLETYWPVFQANGKILGA